MITPPLALGVRLSLRHDLGGKPHHVECPDKVDGDGAGESIEPVRAVATENLFAGRGTGTIHQSMETTEFPPPKRQCLSDVSLVRHIDLSEMHARTKLGGKLFHGLRLHVQGQHDRAFASQHAGHGCAEPGTGPRDDEDAAPELHLFHSSMFSSG